MESKPKNTEDSPTIPNVVVLGPITPAVESVQAEELSYKKLSPAVQKHEKYESDRYRRMWSSEEDSVNERLAAQQLAMQNLLFTAEALRLAVKPESKELWSQRYTQASSELYGSPDEEIARRLTQEHGEMEKPFERAAEAVKEYFEQKYSTVFEALEEGLEPGHQLKPAEVAQRFLAAVDVLAREHDEDWSRWHIDQPEDKAMLSVSAGSEKISVGSQRADIPANELRGLFAHEVLIHAQSGLNGRKISSELQTGYPGYLDNQEGQGVFVEYALSGKISQKIVDRYVDIAYALGQIDGEPHTRHELINVVMERALVRNAHSDNPKLFEAIDKEVHTHVNRIYRGSLGNEYIGIFTKDIAYYKGFSEVGDYIEQQLEAGESIEGVMDYMLQGKFDPTIPAHVAKLQEQKAATEQIE